MRIRVPCANAAGVDLAFDLVGVALGSGSGGIDRVSPPGALVGESVGSANRDPRKAIGALSHTGYRRYRSFSCVELAVSECSGIDLSPFLAVAKAMQ